MNELLSLLRIDSMTLSYMLAVWLDSFVSVPRSMKPFQSTGSSSSRSVCPVGAVSNTSDIVARQAEVAHELLEGGHLLGAGGIRPLPRISPCLLAPALDSIENPGPVLGQGGPLVDPCGRQVPATCGHPGGLCCLSRAARGSCPRWEAGSVVTRSVLISLVGQVHGSRAQARVLFPTPPLPVKNRYLVKPFGLGASQTSPRCLARRRRFRGAFLWTLVPLDGATLLDALEEMLLATDSSALLARQLSSPASDTGNWSGSSREFRRYPAHDGFLVLICFLFFLKNPSVHASSGSRPLTDEQACLDAQLLELPGATHSLHHRDMSGLRTKMKDVFSRLSARPAPSCISLSLRSGSCSGRCRCPLPSISPRSSSPATPVAGWCGRSVLCRR